MSLTLPSAYSSASKLGNIQENWFVQLGFYNGDSDGSGEGGWDAVLDTDGDANLLDGAFDDNEIDIDVDDGTVFVAGDFIKVESEIMKILSISTNTITVERGAMSTSGAEHDNNTAIYWNNFTPISLADTTVDSVFYHGTITNIPSIRSSIDLSNSTAKTGNISLSIVNFQYQGDDFSAELFLGTRKYINREVRIYSQLNGDSTLSNCLQVYNGRLIDISHDDASIKLTLTEQRPWDFITIPNKKMTNNVYIPVSYGDFTSGYAGTNIFADEPTYASLDFVDIVNKFRPVPYYKSSGGYNRYVNGEEDRDGEGKLFFYDKGMERFIPFETTKVDTNADGDGYYSFLPIPSTRGFKYHPNAHELTEASSFNYSNFISPATSYNEGESFATDYGSFYHFITSTATDVIRVRFDFPKLYGTQYTDGNDTIAYISWAMPSGSPHNVFGAGDYVNVYYSINGGSFTVFATEANAGDTTTTSITLTDGEYPNTLELKMSHQGNGSSTFRMYVYDIYAKINLKNEEESEIIPILYSKANGLTESWSGDSDAIQYGHEAHRDMLIRYTGYTTTEPENWSELDTDRSLPTWKIRWWELEPVELKKVLEQLQYEFGFVFKFRPDGTGSYVYIRQSSELSALLEQTLKQDDISNLKINNMPFSELLTKMEINYETHPAENLYLSNVTSSNATARANWNIQTKENISDVNLDMNVGTPNTSGQTDGNADFYSYYDNIFGDIKKTISCDIVNPAVSYNLETGDIIQFSNTAGEMPVEPFGDDWQDYYMITDLQRSPGKIGIQAREVG